LVDDVADALVLSLEVDGILGEAFNLVDEPSLSAREYVAELEKAAGVKIDVRAKAAPGRFIKWVIKMLVPHPGRRLLSYRDWQTRSHRSRFDCSRAKQKLGWRRPAIAGR
jgi:nucleoside-diphosphate-sugar epimerase